METDEDWSDETIQLKLEEVFARHVPELTSSLTDGEMAEAKEAYLRAFELMFYACNSPSAFDTAIRKAVAEFVALGADGPKRVLRDQRYLREIGSINSDVWDTAERILLGTEQLTPETRERVAREDERLTEIVRAIKAECPYLLDSRLPQPPFPLTGGRALSHQISECTLDADYILHEGRRRFMSFRLGRLYQDRRGKPAP